MFLNLIEKYGEFIQSHVIINFDQDGPNIKFKARVIFIDGSILFIKQIVLEGSTFKYAYQWQEKTGNLICRWDNAAHWPEVVTYPHHQHLIFENKLIVKESRGGDLDAVFEEIINAIRLKSV